MIKSYPDNCPYCNNKLRYDEFYDGSAELSCKLGCDIFIRYNKDEEEPHQILIDYFYSDSKKSLIVFDLTHKEIKYAHFNENNNNWVWHCFKSLPASPLKYVFSYSKKELLDKINNLLVFI